MASSPSSRGGSPSHGAGESPGARVKPRTGDVAARGAAAKLKAESKRKEIADMMRLHRASRAAQAGDCQLLSDLISEQASIVASQDFQGRTLVHLAAAAGQGDAIRLLAAQGADMDARDNDGMAPLHIAAINAQVGAAAALLEQRADPLAVDTTGAPAGVSRMSSRVSSRSANQTISSNDHFGGKRAIFYAFRAGCPGLVEILRRATASNAGAAKKKHTGAAPDEGSPSKAKGKQETKLANDVDPREDDPGMEGLDDQARGLFRLPVEMLDDAARRAADAEEEAARSESKLRDQAAAKQVAAAVGEVESKEAETGEGHEASIEQVLEAQTGSEEDSKPSGSATSDLPEKPDQGTSAQSPAPPLAAAPAQGTQSGTATATATATGGVSRAAPPPPVPHPPPGTYASPLRVQFELPGGDPDSVVFASACPHEPAACGRVVTREQPLVLVDPSSEDGMSGADLAAADAWLVARLGGGKGAKGGSARQDLYDDMVAMGSSAQGKGAGTGAGGGLKTAREREAEARADRVSQARAALATISKDRRVPAAAMEVAGLDAHWDALEAVADPGIPLRNTMARVEALRQRFRAGPQPPPEPAVLEDGNPTTAERRRRLELQRQARTSETASGGAVGSGARMQAQASAADAVVRGRKLGSAGVPQGDMILDGPRSNPASAVAEDVANERAALVAEGALRVAQQQQHKKNKHEGGEGGSEHREQGSSSRQRVLGGGEQGLDPVEQAEERVAGDGVPVKRGTTRFVRATVRSPDGRWSDVVTLRYRLLSPLEQFFDASPKALWSAEGRLVAFGLTSLRRLMSADRGLLRRAFSRIGILQRQSEALIQALKREWRKRQLKEREEQGAAYVSPRAPARQQPGDRESPAGTTSTRGRGKGTRDGAVSPMGVAVGAGASGSGRGRGPAQPHSMGHGEDPGEPSVVLIGSTADAHVLGNNSAVDGVHSRLQEGSMEDSEMRALAIETGPGGEKRGGVGAGAGVVPSSPMGRKGLPLAASPASTQGSDGNRHTDLAAGSISLEQGSFAGSEVGLGRGGAVGGGQYQAHEAHGSPGAGLRQLQREREIGHGGALGPVRSLTSASAERLMARQHVQQHQEGDSTGSGMKRHVSFQS